MKDYIGQELNLGDFFVPRYCTSAIGVIIKKSEQKKLIDCYCCDRNELGSLDVYAASIHSDAVIAIEVSVNMPDSIYEMVEELKTVVATTKKTS